MTKIGTIEGRHPLPVDEYLLHGDQVPGQASYEAAFDAAIGLASSLWSTTDWEVVESSLFPSAGAKAYPRQPRVDLYYTGLTEVTLGAIDGLQAGKVAVTLYRYDAQKQDYEVLERTGKNDQRIQDLDAFMEELRNPQEAPKEEPPCPKCGKAGASDDQD